MVATAEADDTPPEEDKALEQGSPPAEEAEATPEKKQRRRPRVSKDTPRERRELDPGDTCPDCGGDLRVVGEDVSELLDMIAAQIKVIEIARMKKSCRRCEAMVQEPAPSRPIPRSMTGPSLLALHPRVEVRRSRAALSTERNLRPYGGRYSRHHDGRLVRQCHEDFEPADRKARGRCHVQRSCTPTTRRSACSTDPERTRDSEKV